MKKCIKKTYSLFIWMLIGLAIGAILFSLANQVYEILYKWMPDIFPLYGAVTQNAPLVDAYRHNLYFEGAAMILTLV